MTTTHLSLEEYLRTDYEQDCDYVDGALEERNAGEQEHSAVQAYFVKWLAAYEEHMTAAKAAGSRLISF